MPGASLIVGVAYRPPSADNLVLEALVDYVSIINRKHDLFSSAGDFNLPQIDWRFFSLGFTCINWDVLLDMAFNNSLVQTVTNWIPPLASGDSVLGLIFVSNAIPKRGYERDVTGCLSDHLAVFLYFDGP